MNKEALKVYLFCCSSNFNPGELIACYEYGDELKVVPLPCSGKIDILYLTKAFETGADGVAVVTCQQGECRYLEGNLRARKRVEVIDGLLEEIGVGKGRAIVIEMGDGGIEDVAKKLNNFRSNIKVLPGLTPVASVPVSHPGK
jgi:F420-non-reducing hydrogenase iron-sulfur subunit